MIIKIHSTKTVAGGNQGSSSDLVNYLTKEDLEKEPLEREGFFNHTRVINIKKMFFIA
jgi:hypothetical protein